MSIERDYLLFLDEWAEEMDASARLSARVMEQFGWEVLGLFPIEADPDAHLDVIAEHLERMSA
jgi:hypothetical protein